MEFEEENSFPTFPPRSASSERPERHSLDYLNRFPQNKGNFPFFPPPNPTPWERRTGKQPLRPRFSLHINNPNEPDWAENVWEENPVARFGRIP
jgi:hypothetical protein